MDVRNVTNPKLLVELRTQPELPAKIAMIGLITEALASLFLSLFVEINSVLGALAAWYQSARH